LDQSSSVMQWKIVMSASTMLSKSTKSAKGTWFAISGGGGGGKHVEEE
jgi:hypothetical protein